MRDAVARDAVELHQALGGREGGDEHRHEARKRADGILYLTDKLNEGNERAIGDDVGLQTEHAPHEGDKIARGETDIHDGGRSDGVPGLAQHFAMKPFLQAVQFAYHVAGLLQGLDDEGVLQAFLYGGLHLALRVADVARETAHLADIKFAAHQEEGNEQ